MNVLDQLGEDITHTMLSLQGKVYVMYIAMKTFNNFDNWMKLATVRTYVLHTDPNCSIVS